MDDREFLEQHIEIKVGMYADADCAIYIEGGWRRFSYPAARAWLEARLKAIAEVEEEIAWLAEETYVVPKRILSREQSVLAELRKGLK